jgi:hypothetical protein
MPVWLSKILLALHFSIHNMEHVKGIVIQACIVTFQATFFSKNKKPFYVRIKVPIV